MGNLHKTITSIGLVGVALIWQAVACSSNGATCEADNTCADNGGADAGDDGPPPPPPPPPGCDKAPSEDATVLEKDCGVFVSNTVMGAGTPDGSAANPYKTIGEAVAANKSSNIFVCADGDYAESITIIEGMSVYGGLGCEGGKWTYSGTKAKLVAPVPAAASAWPAAMHINDSAVATAVSHIQDMEILSPDYAEPAPAMTAGSSTMAVAVFGATVVFDRCRLEARRAQAGGKGEELGSDGALDGENGAAGAAACEGDVINGNPGGAAKAKTCGSDNTGSGKGGDGGLIMTGNPPTLLAGGDGLAGETQGKGGTAGTGEPAAGGSCTNGGPGAEGSSGDDGGGAKTLATLDLDKGFVAMPGSGGTAGTSGFGGGGGGGTRGGTTICQGMKAGAGASGGSGGSGGCGGKGGGGGLGGGASVTLASVNGFVTLNGSELVGGKGGDGGAGGAGQPGGAGGFGGIGGQGKGGSKPSCLGGNGGSGGPGGKGGGGAAGPSYVVAHVGTAPTKDAATTYTKGADSVGGLGGGGQMSNKGVDAKAEEVKSFP